MANGRMDEWCNGVGQGMIDSEFPDIFAVAPGKVVGYARNIHTVEELGQNGYEVIRADDIIDGKRSIDKTGNCIITLDGSELPRGGGGARCMTMPVRRKSVLW